METMLAHKTHIGNFAARRLPPDEYVKSDWTTIRENIATVLPMPSFRMKGVQLVLKSMKRDDLAALAKLYLGLEDLADWSTEQIRMVMSAKVEHDVFHFMAIK